MDLNYKIICHPNELLSRGNKQIIDWLNEIVSTKNTTIEIPIKNDIYYPIPLIVDPKSNGLSRFQILKASFYFYMENEIDNDFLISVGIELNDNNKCWYDYVDENVKEIKTIEKIDDDEFIIIHKSEIQLTINKNKNIFIHRDLKTNSISVLCKKCHKLVLVEEKNVKDYLDQTYKCSLCNNILIDVIYK